jgi:hypothetical protein
VIFDHAVENRLFDSKSGVLVLRIADYIYCEDDLRDVVKKLSFKTTKNVL